MPHIGGGATQPGVRASPYEPGVYFVREETWHVRTVVSVHVVTVLSLVAHAPGLGVNLCIQSQVRAGG